MLTRQEVDDRMIAYNIAADTIGDMSCQTDSEAIQAYIAENSIRKMADTWYTKWMESHPGEAE